MPVESAADRATLLADWGISATYRPASDGLSTVLTGLLETPQLDVAIGQVEMSDRRVALLVCSADLPAGAVGGGDDTLAIDGVTYAVVDLQSDGTGFTLIILAAA